MKLKKLLIFFVFAIFLFSTAVYAVEDVALLSPAPTFNVTNADVYITQTDSYTLTDVINGSVFASVATKFSTNPRTNGGIINGNLYLFSSEVVIGSDVTYGNSIDENGTYSIESINSASKINGNVYAFAQSFTLEAGSEIAGDLYLFTNELNIEPGAVIRGNLIVKSTTTNFAGEVDNSAYIFSDIFNMKSSAKIQRDLFLNSTNSNIYGVVFRNVHLTVTDKLNFKSSFVCSGDLYVNYAEDLNVAGTIAGNTYINAKNITLDSTVDNSLLINGNLNYATPSSLDIPDGTVIGEISSSNFVDYKKSHFDFQQFAISIISFLVYVFVIVFLFKKFGSKTLEALPAFNFGNILKSLLIGLLSMVALIPLFLILLLSGIGLTLGLLLVLAYLLIIGLSIPLFINKIADKLNFKVNSYIKLLIVAIILFLVKEIPYIGSIAVWLIILAGLGDILITIFKKN